MHGLRWERRHPCYTPTFLKVSLHIWLGHYKRPSLAGWLAVRKDVVKPDQLLGQLARKKERWSGGRDRECDDMARERIWGAAWSRRPFPQGQRCLGVLISLFLPPPPLPLCNIVIVLTSQCLIIYSRVFSRPKLGLVASSGGFAGASASLRYCFLGEIECIRISLSLTGGLGHIKLSHRLTHTQLCHTLSLAPLPSLSLSLIPLSLLPPSQETLATKVSRDINALIMRPRALAAVEREERASLAF